MRGISLILSFVFVIGVNSTVYAKSKKSPQKGVASWYGANHHGKRTASGEKFNMNDLTAAHKTLPLGSIVKVKSLTTGKSVTVRINDRGPYAHGRIIDVSKKAAQKLGFIHKGTDRVEVRLISSPRKPASHKKSFAVK